MVEVVQAPRHLNHIPRHLVSFSAYHLMLEFTCKAAERTEYRIVPCRWRWSLSADMYTLVRIAALPILSPFLRPPM